MKDIEIVVRDAVGTETEITEAVKILYDIVHASMDWGSGFLDADEMANVLALSEVCGFEPPEAPTGSWVQKDYRNAVNRAKDIRAMFRSVPVVRPGEKP